MKAKLGKENDNARNYGSEKETVNEKNLVTIYKGEICSPVRAAWYMGRSASASVVYCSIWVRNIGFYTSGRGSAGGGGYHKESAALGEAIRSAGIELDQAIDGCGDRAMDEALEAIGRALGYRGKMKIV